MRGQSMLPTLSDQDVVLVRVGARARARSVVLVQWSGRPGQVSVKRAVRRDGSGWCVEGDNTARSTDSRVLGPAEVLGVVRWRLWPHPGRVR